MLAAYERLEKTFQRLDNLQHLKAIASWDEACMMPDGGGDARAAAMAEVSMLCNEIITSDQTGQNLAVAQQEAQSLTRWQQANLREMTRQYHQETCFSADFIEKMVLTNTKAEQMWRKLRPENDWQGFLPYFTDVVAVAREQARILAAKSGCSPYDALIDIYEPGRTASQIAAMFQPLKDQLPEIIAARLAKQEQDPCTFPRGLFPIAKQKQLGTTVMTALGFDFNHGRLDISHHPFCGGVPQDVRITTRYRDDEFLSSLMGIIHETGHARYEQCRPKDWLNQPVSRARGMGMHEGQSLLFELQVGHAPAFIKYLTPLIKGHFADCAPDFDFSEKNILRLINHVAQSYIRVDADELTYPLHIILRFEIEEALIAGTIEAADVPAIWNEKMQTYLGLSTTGNDQNGCLQDVHWPSGAFGYFPSYTLGAMTAAQIFAAAQRAIPDLSHSMAAGDFRDLNSWVATNVWGQGSFLTTSELMINATGEDLDSRFLIEHLTKRYLS